MLIIKDLIASKELDRKAMTCITGGSGIPPFALNIGSPFNAPKLAELMAIATSSTGAQFNTNEQSDNDYNVVIGSGQVINTGGNRNMTVQDALSRADNIESNFQ